MPRNRLKPNTNDIPDELLKEIIAIRPLRLYINKQKKKGILDKSLILRKQYYQLSENKQTRYFQRSVNKYIELLDEKDIDENIQIDCDLFRILLKAPEQRKYFQSISAPLKPPGTAKPFYTQLVKQEIDDDTQQETPWSSLTEDEQNSFKRKRKEAQMEYSAQVKNFANDLPERLRTEYLLYTGQLSRKSSVTSTPPIVNGHDDIDHAKPIKKRRKSLTALPDSLQTPSSPLLTDDNQLKLTKTQLADIHKCMPCVLHYELDVSERDKPTFTRITTKNAYQRGIFNELNEENRFKYILLSIDKWKEFLRLNPIIIEKQIPTLHLLLPKNEDIVLYFSSLGLPTRPPLNSFLLYNIERDQIDSTQSWTDLSEKERHDYSQQLIDLKNEYYEKLIDFIEHNLTSDYIKYEFFRNVKHAMKDYELASKNGIIEDNLGKFNLPKYYTKKVQINSDMNQFNQIKQKLLATELTQEQKILVEELTQLLYKCIE